MKLGIGLPLTSEKVDTPFLDSWILMDKPSFIYMRPQFPAGTTNNIASVRNEIVQQALQNDVTHLLMMDTDQVFPSDLIERLLAHNKSIIAAKVHRRYPPFDPILYYKKNENFLLTPEKDWKNKKLVEVDATGHGCVLIDTNVFLDVEYPWYEFIENENGSKIGEDINFCCKARKVGYKIFVDISIQIGHIGPFEFNEAFYDIYKKLKFKMEEEK